MKCTKQQQQHRKITTFYQLPALQTVNKQANLTNEPTNALFNFKFQLQQQQQQQLFVNIVTAPLFLFKLAAVIAISYHHQHSLL